MTHGRPLRVNTFGSAIICRFSHGVATVEGSHYRKVYRGLREVDGDTAGIGKEAATDRAQK